MSHHAFCPYQDMDGYCYQCERLWQRFPQGGRTWEVTDRDRSEFMQVRATMRDADELVAA